MQEIHFKINPTPLVRLQLGVPKYIALVWHRMLGTKKGSKRFNCLPLSPKNIYLATLLHTSRTYKSIKIKRVKIL